MPGLAVHLGRQRPVRETRRAPVTTPASSEQRKPVPIGCDPLASPIDQVEALQPWLLAQGRELARIFCCVDCQLAEKQPVLLQWFEDDAANEPVLGQEVGIVLASANVVVGLKSGTTERSFELSKITECDLSPSSPGPQSGIAAAIRSDAMCTSVGSTPAAVPSMR